MFKVNQTTGSGFQMTFSNGWTVSVQWGPSTYSDNYNAGSFEKGMTSKTAEIGAWDDQGNWHQFEGDTVMGWVHPDQVANFIALIANK